MIYEIIYFFIVGLLAGVVGGLFGVGGGFLFIPAQLFIYNYFDIPEEIQMKMAIATSLGAVVFNTLAASFAHYKKNAIYFPILKKILPGIVIGSILGSYVTKMVPSNLLGFIFGAFECLFGFYFIIARPVHETTPIKNINPLIMNTIVAFTSGLSIILGIGGGIFLIPLLTLLHLPLKKAIGSSSLATLAVAFLGTITLLIPTIPLKTTTFSTGYLYLPAFLPLALSAIIGAPIGVKLTHYLPTKILKKCFGLFLIVIGIFILLK